MDGVQNLRRILSDAQAAVHDFGNDISAVAYGNAVLHGFGNYHAVPDLGRALAADGRPAQGIESARKAVLILGTVAAADRADTNFKLTDLAYAHSALAETYSRLAAHPGTAEPTKTASWREARSWYQKSLDIWLLLKQKAPLGKFDAAQPEKIAAEIASCDAALAKRNISNPSTDQNASSAGEIKIK